MPALDAVGLSREKACFVRLPVKETLGPKIPVTMKLAEGGKSTVNSITRDRGYPLWTQRAGWPNNAGHPSPTR